jgi:hypothetical protein
MTSIHLGLLLCVLGIAPEQPAAGEPTPAKIEAFLKSCESSRRGAVLQLEHKLRGLRRQSATSEQQRQIARAETELRLLRANERPVVPQLPFPPTVGAIGRLPRLTCHVDRVISADEALVRCYFPVVVTTVRNFTARRETVVHAVRFVLRGLPTGDLRESSDREMLGVFEVVGKQKYQAADGSTSDVYLLTEFDMRAVEPYFRKIAGKEAP